MRSRSARTVTARRSAASGSRSRVIQPARCSRSAAVGVVLFFVAALFVHLRARDYALGPVTAFGLLSVAALALGLA
ncbi:MAG TPA: hypothetical protein VH008_30090 [Pseudonocardia sp.]|nr:hypothetical protein [Pseudonocardia sp.]